MSPASRIPLLASLLACLTVSTGCGGDGSDVQLVPSPFAGTYRSGSFAATGNVTGRASGTVGTNGVLFTSVNLTSGSGGTFQFVGTIQSDGSFSGRVDPVSTPPNPGQTTNVTGEFEEIEGGIRGTATGIRNGLPYTVELTLLEAAEI